MTRSTSGALLALVAMIASCSQGGASGPADNWPEGRSFLSTSIAEGGTPRPLVNDTRILLTFRTNDQLDAIAGCNHLGGKGRLADGVLAVTDFGGTEMSCDQARMDQDRWLGNFLTGKPTFKLDGDDLVLRHGDMEVRLVDERVAGTAKPLVGTKWFIDTVVNADTSGSMPDPAQGREPAHLLFAADGTFVGSDGCNSFGGKAAVSGAQITFSDTTSTLVACPGPLATAGATVAQTLRGAVTYQIVGNFLTLTTADGKAGLRLRAA